MARAGSHQNQGTSRGEIAVGHSFGRDYTNFWRSLLIRGFYSPPTPLAAAIHQVEAWLQSPSLVLLAETEEYWPELRVTLEQGRISGPQVHDARVAAICRDHGVRELWTSDRDFSRFPQLTVVNPLVA